MYYDAITTKADIKRLPNGEIQCGDSHWRGYRSTGREPAVAVVVEYYHEAASVYRLAFVCKRHLGTVKANITKGSWSFRDCQIVEDLTPEDVAKDPEAVIATLAAKHQAEREEARRQVKQAKYERVLAGWDKAHADYNVAADLDPKGVSLTVPDDYGRVYVHATASRVTPNEARAMANKLWRLAAMAEDETAVAQKPVQP